MGGPMSYARMVNRNRLTGWGYMAQQGDPIAPTLRDSVDINGHGSYSKGTCTSLYTIEGEMRRMELDTLAVDRVQRYASMAGITEEQAGVLLRTFLGIPEPGCEKCSQYYSHERGKHVSMGRCNDHVVW